MQLLGLILLLASSWYLWKLTSNFLDEPTKKELTNSFNILKNQFSKGKQNFSKAKISEAWEKYKEELSTLYSSKFDLIFDHKLKIDQIKINEIVKLLEHKSNEKLKNLDYGGAIKALRRADKYISN